MKNTHSRSVSRLLAGSCYLLLTVSGPAAIPQVPPYFEVADVPTSVSGATYMPSDIVRNSMATYSLAASLPAGVTIDALHLLDGGDWLLSVDVPTNLGAATWDPRDVIRWDGAAGFTPFAPYAGALPQIPSTSDVDAVFVDHTGAVVVSFDVPTTIGSSTYQPADLARYNGSTFDPAPLTLPGIPTSANLVAADRLGMLLVLSFDVPVTLGSDTYLPGDLATWTGHSLVPFDAQPAWPGTHSSAVNALTFHPSPAAGTSAPGEFPGSPRSHGLVVDRLTDGMLRLSWSASDCAGGVNTGIYQGTMGAWYSHTAIACSDPFPYLQEDVPTPAGNAYFLVVPYNTVHQEGSYGVRHAGGVVSQRPRGTVVCQPDQVLACAP